MKSVQQVHGFDNFSRLEVVDVLFQAALAVILNVTIYNSLTQSMVQSLFRRAPSIMCFQALHGMFTGDKLPAETIDAQREINEIYLYNV